MYLITKSLPLTMQHGLIDIEYFIHYTIVCASKGNLPWYNTVFPVRLI